MSMTRAQSLERNDMPKSIARKKKKLSRAEKLMGLHMVHLRLLKAKRESNLEKKIWQRNLAYQALTKMPCYIKS